MVEIRIEYEGELRCRAVHGPSGTELVSDAPVDNRGKGESFSPTDLVATALGTCMLTLMGMRARDRGVELGRVAATVEKRMVADPARRIGRLEVDVRVAADCDAETRKAIEEAALGCPVTVSLSKSAIEVGVRFHWGSA